MRKQSPERLSDLPKVAQQVSGKGQIRTPEPWSAQAGAQLCEIPQSWVQSMGRARSVPSGVLEAR